MWKTGALGRNLISNVSAKPVLKYQRHYRGFTSQPKHESTGLMEGAIQNLISKFCLHRPGELLKQDTFEQLYQRHHISTNPFQKLMISIGSSLTALSNPLRGDMVPSVLSFLTTRSPPLEKLPVFLHLKTYVM